MKLILKILLSLLIILVSACKIYAQGQVKTFAEDPVKFMEELKDFMESGSQDKKAMGDFMDDFAKSWKLGKFSPEIIIACQKTSNLMLKKRLRPVPDFKGYLSCLLSFVNSGQAQKNFTAWQDCVDKILNGKALKFFSDYMNMSEGLFFSNSFYKSPTYEWSSNNSNYIFEYDSVPIVIFPSFNLGCYNSKSDSTNIYNTTGTYYPYTGKFIGKGGRVNWSRVGMDPNVVYADIKNYTIICKSGGYTIDSVTFYHKQYFDHPLRGSITEKMISEDIKVSSYPRFESYNKRLQINGLAEGVDYDGGFSMRGAKFIGSGNKEQDAYLKFKRNGKDFIIVGSKEFVVSKEKLYAANANIKMYLDTDTIYHPGLIFTYIINKKQLSLIRSEQGLGKTPYFNTFHMLDMYFEELYWKTDEPKMDFRMLVGSTQSEGDFESTTYYKQDRYDKLQGMDDVHPLIKIRDYVKSLGGYRSFTAVDLARFIRYSVDDVRPLIVHLASMGLLNYQADEDMITVEDRLFKYVSNRAGKTDYDVLTFHSAIHDETNASLNLLNYDLTIRGIKSILLSDSQNVFIYPKNETVVVKKNRNFNFAGIVNAGRFEFFGKEFLFEYDKFKINLTNVDSLRIKVQSLEPDERGEYPLVRVKTVVENITGDLLIDNPKNKSGVKPFPQYPIFNSFKESFVYYDKKNIQHGVYNRDNFYFKLEPFTIDSLDTFTNKSLSFKGDMSSAGIFPQFKESLALQPDYSLGFIRPTPPEGFPLYGGKAKFTNTIKLSNQGLRGDGDINFVTSLTKSNDIIFFPDSLNVQAQNFDVAEQKAKIEFPQVKGEGVYVHFMPKNDLMQIYSKDKPFSSYNGQAEFKGRYDLTPKMLTGEGKATFGSGELESKKILFNKINSFDSDTADFRLQARDLSALAFSTTNVNAHIDFNTRSGDFKSNGRGSIVKFPVNQYMCYMDNFKWYMDKSDIDIGSDQKHASDEADLELTGSEFISTHPKQDSLRFVAPFAKYDVKNYIISAKNVKYINVADARIYPDSGNVTILKNAVMKTLTSARLLANTVNKQHNLYNCTINIFARKDYSGSGYYDYVDELKAKQSIYFSNIQVDTTYQTYAATEVLDTAHFTLSPSYDYRGKIQLFASKRYLFFDGAARIQHTCDKLVKSWFRFTSEINPEQIYIPVTEDPVDDEKNKLGASILLSNDSTHIYSAFLSNKRSKNDNEVLSSSGFLYFDKSSQEYRISNKEKLVERALPGNYLALKTKSCIVSGEGKLNMGVDLGQVKMQVVGNGTHFLIPDSAIFEMMMGLDFFFDDNTIEKISGEIEKSFTALPLTDFSKSTYEKGLRELLGKELSDKLISQVNLYGTFKKFPDELKHTLFFNDLNMKWNTPTRSYVSTGKIGMGSINKEQINKYVDGKIEIVKKRGADAINIYIELDANNWYFFSYSRGLMQAISSNENFNTVIKTLKADKRQAKTDKGQAAYQFNLSTLIKKNSFVKKFTEPEPGE